MRRLGFFAAAALLASGLGQPAWAQCNLGNGIKHVVYIQFDNVHFRRDNPNVPSDLEQMPNLLNFLEGNGTFLTNHWTPLISHTAVDILTSLTGVYPDKFGVPIGNSLRYFNPDGTTNGMSSFAYWTDPVAAFSGQTPTDLTPQMIDQRKKIHPAPWVPFTRAGCDVGAFSAANIEFENIGLDIATVFGAGSPEQAEATNDPTKASADFLGIALHCAQASALCAPGKPDLLPDEPGGYAGFKALFGNKYVQPQISSGGPVKDLDGNVIQDAKGNPGFPNSFSPTASQTLGYLATMLEAGVPVVYGYIADAHDNRGPAVSGVSTDAEQTFGPGEAGYVKQLQAYDRAFGEFFTRLAADKIAANTLFVITADENDHFAGGPPSPGNCDGVTIPCTYAKIGEIDIDLSQLMATEFGEGSPFAVHSDDAPTFYINGNPGQLTSLTRRFEREAAGLTAVNPITGKTDVLTQAIADQQQQTFLHMVTTDPNRTPNFIMFANPDYFLSATGNTTHCVPLASCSQEGPGFAWNHGGFQTEVTNTWLGVAGPGIQKVGLTGAFFSDHSDIRPTMMSLAGLTDDYAHDGRVLVEVMTDGAVPAPLQQHRATFTRLAGVYKAINAPLGTLGMRTLKNTTAAIQGSDAAYIGYLAQLKALTGERNAIAGHMIQMIEASEFGGIPLNDIAANVQIILGQSLLGSTP